MGLRRRTHILSRNPHSAVPVNTYACTVPGPGGRPIPAQWKIPLHTDRGSKHPGYAGLDPREIRHLAACGTPPLGDPGAPEPHQKGYTPCDSHGDMDVEIPQYPDIRSSSGIHPPVCTAITDPQISAYCVCASTDETPHITTCDHGPTCAAPSAVLFSMSRLPNLSTQGATQ
jgi:hypothetical protein